MGFNVVEVILVITSVVVCLLGFLSFIFKRFDAMKKDLDNVTLQQKFIVATIKLLSKDMRKVKKKLKLD